MADVIQNGKNSYLIQQESEITFIDDCYLWKDQKSDRQLNAC